MKKLCGLVVLVGMLSAVPAMAGEYGGGRYGGGQMGGGQFANGQGFTNIWSSAQGTSNSYGNAKAMSGSAAISSAPGRGGYQVTFGSAAGVTSATSSFAKTMSNGNGYAQAQTSGYAGGTATGAGARGR